jgi:hypothetical protein
VQLAPLFCGSAPGQGYSVTSRAGTTSGFRLPKQQQASRRPGASSRAGTTSGFRLPKQQQANQNSYGVFRAGTTPGIRPGAQPQASRRRGVFFRAGTTPGFCLTSPPQASRDSYGVFRACTTTGLRLSLPPQASRRRGAASPTNRAKPYPHICLSNAARPRPCPLHTALIVVPAARRRANKGGAQRGPPCSLRHGTPGLLPVEVTL